MVFPKTSTINNVFTNGVRNAEWNANGGSFGYESSTNRAFVNTTATPSFVGSASHSITDDAFFAQVGVAPVGNGTTRTSLIIKHDETNYVEMYVDSERILRATSVSNTIPELISPAPVFPAYSATTHAYWKISNSNHQFTFWTSPNTTTWTPLVTYNYNWDADNVTVMFLSGFNGSNESSLNRAYISSVNSTPIISELSATVSNIDGIGSLPKITDPNALSVVVSGFSNTKSKFTATGGLPEGGLTDFSITTLDDSARFRYNLITRPTFAGSASVTWARPTTSTAITTHYRDGSYWPPTKYMYAHVGGVNPPDQNLYAFTNVQIEEVPGPFNRLDANAAFYTTTSEYSPQQASTPTGADGSTRVVRSKDIALAGNYSGKMTYGGTPVVDGGGRNVYYPYPTKQALTPILFSGANQEIIRGTVSINTTRAGTQWYAALFLYDVNFNITAQSTFSLASGVTLSTHPGGGIWQQASVQLPATATTSVWAAVVPVVVAPGSGTETVYMSGHAIQGITPDLSSAATAYTNPRELTISLKADRINLAKNSGFTSSIDGWTTLNAGVTTAPDVSDSFSRTVSNGWGTAPIGGTWVTSGGAASDYSVNGSKGVHSLPAVSSSRRTTLTTTAVNQDIRGSISTNSFAVGASIFGHLVGRSVDDNNQYMARLEFTTSQTIILSLRKRVTSTETQLATVTTSLTHVAVTDYNVRFMITGTTLQAKAWLSGTTEPANWMLTVTDSSFSAAQSVGCRSVLNAGNTNVSPVPVLYDNFSLNNSPLSIGWDPTVGFNSLGSLKVSFVPPTAGTSGGSTATMGAAARLLNISSTQFPIVTRLQIGETYTVSMYIKQGPNCPNVIMNFMDPNYTIVLTTDINSTKTANPNATVNGWTRINGTFVVPPNALSDYRPTVEVLLSDIQANSPFDFWVDSILVEKGNQLNDYFDGSFGSADYQYEKQGTADNRSYYYKDYTNKLVRVNQIVPQYAPLGSTVTILSAQAP